MPCLLVQGLSNAQQHWGWVDRDNTAVRLHPTDFALLSVEVEQLPLLQQLLQRVAGYKDMHPDRRIRGSSNWQPEGPLAAAFSDGQLPQQQQEHHPALRQAAPGLKLIQEPAWQQQQQHSQQSPSLAGVHSLPSKQLLADAPDSVQQALASSKPVDKQPQPQPPAEQQVQPPTDEPAPDAADEDSIWSVSKPPGRMSTAHTIGLDPKNKADREAGYNKDELRRRRRGLLGWAADWWGGSSSGQEQQGLGRGVKESVSGVTALLEAPVLWKQGFSGKGIKVGVVGG